MRDANEDGRPLVIHQVGDFDPSGWQMAVSTARTAQALRDTQFPDLDLTVDAVDNPRAMRVVEFAIVATEGNREARRPWREAMGREETELDAAVCWRPESLQSDRRVFTSILRHGSVALTRIQIPYTRLCPQQTIAFPINSGLTYWVLFDRSAEESSRIEDLVDEINKALHIDIAELDIEKPETPATDRGYGLPLPSAG